MGHFEGEKACIERQAGASENGEVGDAQGRKGLSLGIEGPKGPEQERAAGAEKAAEDRIGIERHLPPGSAEAPLDSPGHHHQILVPALPGGEEFKREEATRSRVSSPGYGNGRGGTCPNDPRPSEIDRVEGNPKTAVGTGIYGTMALGVQDVGSRLTGEDIVGGEIGRIPLGARAGGQVLDHAEGDHRLARLGEHRFWKGEDIQPCCLDLEILGGLAQLEQKRAQGVGTFG